uniref:Uncharacterized protein n=1 Tax=Oryza meridionalis TaxID=40149 RepID=A0A0E0F515_9ORYZ
MPLVLVRSRTTMPRDRQLPANCVEIDSHSGVMVMRERERCLMTGPDRCRTSGMRNRVGSAPRFRGSEAVPLSATLPQDRAVGTIWSRSSALRDGAYSAFPLRSTEAATTSALAEWWYNTYHTIIQMTLFKALYGYTHSIGLLPTLTRSELHWLAYCEQPLGAVNGAVAHHATSASEIGHRQAGVHGEVVRYGAAGRVTGDKHAAEVSGLGEPAISIVQGVFPKPVEETRRIVNCGGRRCLRARRYLMENTMALASLMWSSGRGTATTVLRRLRGRLRCSASSSGGLDMLHDHAEQLSTMGKPVELTASESPKKTERREKKIEEDKGKLSFYVEDWTGCLETPTSKGSNIHPIFHVSQLKKHLGAHAVPMANLLSVRPDGWIKTEPVVVLQRRMVLEGEKL